MPKSPDYNVCIRGAVYEQGNKYKYHQIGVAWEEENGFSINIDFPNSIIITPETKLRLFRRDGSGT